MRAKVPGLLVIMGLAGSMVLAACGSSPGGAAAGNGSAAGGSATVIKSDGNYDMVKLAYNEQIFGVSGQQCGSGPGPCFDQGGYSLDPADPALPNKGAAGEVKPGGIPFWFGGNGGGKGNKTGVNFGPEEGGSVTISAPGNSYKTMYILGSAGNGGSPATITFNYADGSKDTATQNFDDWCSAPADGATAYTLTDRMNPAGAQDPGCANSVFLDTYTVAIPGATKALKSINFSSSGDPGNFEPEILAITLQK